MQLDAKPIPPAAKALRGPLGRQSEFAETDSPLGLEKEGLHEVNPNG